MAYISSIYFFTLYIMYLFTLYVISLYILYYKYIIHGVFRLFILLYTSYDGIIYMYIYIYMCTTNE